MFPTVPSARGRGPQGLWLFSKIEARDVTQAELGRELGLLPEQIAGWLTGEQAVPSKHWPQIIELLRLSGQEKDELTFLSEATARHRELIRLFIESERRRKGANKRAAIDLAGHFRDPEQILKRYLDFAEDLIKKDFMTFPPSAWARILHIHIDAADRSAHDIDEFISRADGTLFNERNIGAHLRYPHHYFVSFFLTEVTPADGPHVGDLQAKVVHALEACIDFRNARNVADLRVAQHALHMLARYRGDPVAPYTRDRNPETRRMGYFGEVYRRFDDGPFEELSNLITADEAFGEATFRFDAIHYSDRGIGREAPVVPIKSMTRHLVTLRDPRASMRSVACARIANILRRLDGKTLSDPEFRRRVVDKRHIIEAFRPDDSNQTAVAGELLAISESPEGETK